MWLCFGVHVCFLCVFEHRSKNTINTRFDGELLFHMGGQSLAMGWFVFSLSAYCTTLRILLYNRLNIHTVILRNHNINASSVEMFCSIKWRTSNSETKTGLTAQASQCKSPCGRALFSLYLSLSLSHGYTFRDDPFKYQTFACECVGEDVGWFVCVSVCCGWFGSKCFHLHESCTTMRELIADAEALCRLCAVTQIVHARRNWIKSAFVVCPKRPPPEYD